MASGFTITVHDLRHDTDDEIAEAVAYSNARLAETLPDEPPTRVEDVIAQRRALPPRVRPRAIRARDASRAIVGSASVSIDPEDPDNRDVMWVSLGVAEAHRRRGIGRGLLGALLAIAEEEARSTILCDTHSLEPAGELFARAMGAEVKSRSYTNRLPLERVDRAMLERWVTEASTRSAGYELVGWDGPVADDDIARWIDVVLIMNTAPRDALPLEDFTMTPRDVRDGDRMNAAVGIEKWTLVARHLDTGAWVGFHDVYWSPSAPRVVNVGATAVDPRHRGHALGKWLKAVMTLRILDERPDVSEIRTENADSNDAMLGINRAMGYEPWLDDVTWALDVAAARNRLR